MTPKTTEGDTVSDYPEHDKLAAISDESQVIGEFLETCGYELSEWNDDLEEFRPVRGGTNRILAKHFGIDLDKIEEEKRAMLDTMRTANA
jgi:hypothetical protein